MVKKGKSPLRGLLGIRDSNLKTKINTLPVKKLCHPLATCYKRCSLIDYEAM